MSAVTYLEAMRLKRTLELKPQGLGVVCTLMERGAIGEAELTEVLRESASIHARTRGFTTPANVHVAQARSCLPRGVRIDGNLRPGGKTYRLVNGEALWRIARPEAKART